MTVLIQGCVFIMRVSPIIHLKAKFFAINRFIVKNKSLLSYKYYYVIDDFS